VRLSKKKHYNYQSLLSSTRIFSQTWVQIQSCYNQWGAFLPTFHAGSMILLRTFATMHSMDGGNCTLHPLTQLEEGSLFSNPINWIEQKRVWFSDYGKEKKKWSQAGSGDRRGGDLSIKCGWNLVQRPISIRETAEVNWYNGWFRMGVCDLWGDPQRYYQWYHNRNVEL